MLITNSKHPKYTLSAKLLVYELGIIGRAWDDLRVSSNLFPNWIQLAVTKITKFEIGYMLSVTSITWGMPRDEHNAQYKKYWEYYLDKYSKAFAEWRETHPQFSQHSIRCKLLSQVEN